MRPSYAPAPVHSDVFERVASSTDRPRGHVLVVDDEPDALELMALALRARGHVVHTASSAELAVDAALSADFDVVLTDLRLGGDDGLELCARILAARPTLPIVVVTGDATLATAVAAIRAGAFDYLTKPVDGDLLALTTERALKHHRLESEVARLREDSASARGFQEILGTSAGIQHVLDVIARISSTTASVLVTGESGTGKELVARAVHARSSRAKGPFVALNCAALPHELLESELFGHARGAFTDAKVARKGLFLEANRGTLFLDEIGEMPIATQVKLLRALQEHTVRPVGGAAEVPFDARVIAATNRDLHADVLARRFREDLYYRINVVTIHVPPLRERKGDMRVLAESFLRHFAGRLGRDVRGISPAAMQRLLARSWPGNVRELENAIERAVSMSRSDCLGVEDFSDDERRHDEVVDAPSVLPERVADLVTAEVQEQRYIRHVLAMVDGNKLRAAAVLGYDRRTLHRRLKRADEESRASGSASTMVASHRAMVSSVARAPKIARVLVVDDDIDSRELLQMVLEASGHEVVTASNVQEARARGPVDVVVTDLALADGSGEELVALARPTPVIALSGQMPAAGAGFHSSLVKPAPIADVLAAIARATQN